jgi:cardiolipin synthase
MCGQERIHPTHRMRDIALFGGLISAHGLVIALAILVYVTTSHVMRQRRQPSAAIAWILFMVLVPYVALPAYLIFGSRKLARPGVLAPQRLLARQPAEPWAVATIESLGQPAPAAYSALAVHADGAHARQALFEIIEGAQRSIDLCTFILGSDHLGGRVIDALAARARAGVRVRLLLDGLGNLMGGRPALRPLVRAGAECELFVPPLRSPLKGRTNLRNHRKMLLADAHRADARLWAGGRNLADEYFEGVRGREPWHDLSFDLRGPLVRQAADLFEHDWAFARGQSGFTAASAPAAESGDGSDRGPLVARGAEGAQLIASGPDQVDDTVYALLVAAAYQARRRIGLATPYFVPEPALLMALCLAARRGVAVDLLLPERSNHRLSDFARARALRGLIAAGGRVYLAPAMMHGKLALIDDAVALAGSANLDNRSLFLNYELMFAFHERAAIGHFETWFERERSAARLYVATPPGLMRDVAEGTLLWLGFQL